MITIQEPISDLTIFNSVGAQKIELTCNNLTIPDGVVMEAPSISFKAKQCIIDGVIRAQHVTFDNIGGKGTIMADVIEGTGMVDLKDMHLMPCLNDKYSLICACTQALLPDRIDADTLVVDTDYVFKAPLINASRVFLRARTDVTVPFDIAASDIGMMSKRLDIRAKVSGESVALEANSLGSLVLSDQAYLKARDLGLNGKVFGERSRIEADTLTLMPECSFFVEKANVKATILQGAHKASWISTIRDLDHMQISSLFFRHDAPLTLRTALIKAQEYHQNADFVARDKLGVVATSWRNNGHLLKADKAAFKDVNLESQGPVHITTLEGLNSFLSIGLNYRNGANANWE